MQSEHHLKHIGARVAHNNCQECRADCERQFLAPQWPGYRHVSEYLSYIRPRLDAIQNGEDSVNARIWKRKFIQAMHRRIRLKAQGEQGRKYCDSYLDRLKQFSRSTDASYLRRFAARGASTLN